MNAKFSNVLIACLSLVCSMGSYSQEAEKILKQYIEFSGGKTNWEKISSFKSEGTAKLVSQSMELPFVRIMDNKGRQKTTLKINGMEYVSIACDGEIVWGSNESMLPALKDEDESHNTRILKYDFPFPGYEWKSRGYVAKYLGKKTVEENDTYQIELTKLPQLVDGKEVDNMVILSIDDQTYLPILVESMVMSGPNKGKTMKSRLKDYRNINGLYYPFITEMSYDEEPVFQVLETKDVNWNYEIDPQIYRMPNK